MQGKARRYGLAAPACYVNVLRHCASDIFEHYHAFVPGIGGKCGIFHFGKAQVNVLPRLAAFQFYARHACHVLPHVVNVNPGTYFLDRLCREFLYLPYRLTKLTREVVLRIIVDARVCLAGFKAYVSFEWDFARGLPG